METKTITFRIPTELAKELELVSNTVGMTVNVLLRSAIIDAIQENDFSDYTETTVATNESFRKHLELPARLLELFKAKAEELNTTINSLIVYVTSKYLESYKRKLELLGLFE